MIPHANGLPKTIQTLLRSPAAPIMLTPKACLPAFPEEIAPGLNTVGVMLPANPLQHLLMLDCQRPLVMTSGNLSGHPPVINNQQALEELSDIADGFLLHNRDILQRMDDSVMDRGHDVASRTRFCAGCHHIACRIPRHPAHVMHRRGDEKYLLRYVATGRC